MTTYVRGGRRTRQAVASFAATILIGATFVGSVAAAPPGNDDIGSATIVGALPYADGPYDTTEATTGAADPGFCFEPGAGPDRSTVWYSFTPTVSDSYLADTFGSDYDTTLYVGTPNGAGGIDVIGCVDDVNGLQSAVRWDALAGTTYLLMVGTCCGGGVVGEAGGGGMLEFHVNVGPPPVTIDLSVDGDGSFTPYGTATIRGTIACSGDAQFVEIFVDVSQRVGRITIRGFGARFDESCPTSPTAWSIDVTGDNGKFLGGAAQVNAFAFACGALECADDSVSRTVRLRH
ncbi:MAG TPA: hypothetical protein VGQ58_02910 [Candidatus Limnocylindrales bacterium]|jgi:hypothetical protein|nr:hypothetical protein [Candidatus Limnocylindrales bacterium]